MNIPWWRKETIRSYHGDLQRAGLLSEYLHNRFQQILFAPHPRTKALGLVHRQLYEELWAKFTLSRKGGGKADEAVSLDNLLVALRGFALLFSLFALISAMFLADAPMWLVPLFLVAPLWHCYASRVLRRRLGDGEMADAAHANACRFAIVPLLIGYLVYTDIFRGVSWPLFVPLAWLGHALAVFVLVRSGESFKLLVWVAVVFTHAVVFTCRNWTVPGFDLLMLAAWVWAAALLVLPSLACRSVAGREGGWCRAMAFFLLLLTVFWTLVQWRVLTDRAIRAHTAVWIVMPLVLAVAGFFEWRRLPRTAETWHFLGNLALSLLLPFSVLLYGERQSISLSPRLYYGMICATLYVFVASWSLWMVLVQRRGPESFHPQLLDMGTTGLFFCFIALIWVGLARGWWFLVLGISLAVWHIVRRERKILRAMPAPEKLLAYPHGGGTDEPTGTDGPPDGGDAVREPESATDL